MVISNVAEDGRISITVSDMMIIVLLTLKKKTRCDHDRNGFTEGEMSLLIIAAQE